MLQRSVSRLLELGQLLAFRRRREPIGDFESLVTFVGTRSAYVGQRCLYGYVKQRMGTQYRKHFDDPVYAKSLRAAAAKIVAVCMEDLSIYAAAKLRSEGGLGSGETKLFAKRCFNDALEQIMEPQDRLQLSQEVTGEFQLRLEAVDWDTATASNVAFQRSLRALVRFAPVVDEFKVLDQEIVMNSMRLRWIEIKEQLGLTLRTDAVVSSFREEESASEL